MEGLLRPGVTARVLPLRSVESGVNRFADRRIWPFFARGLRILAIN